MSNRERDTSVRPRICAVSYLNTVPLVWGFLRGEQRDTAELIFRVPAECADLVVAGSADIGIVPAFELVRHDLAVVPGLGIACHGAVRSILLVSRTAPDGIRTLAADSSSRTSVALARIWLERRFGVAPALVPHRPQLQAMLEMADAAVVIGDPALRLDPETLPYRVYDLGAEWVAMTGLPMVFAAWAGPSAAIAARLTEAFQASYRFGRAHLDEIVAEEAATRGFAPDLVRAYLTRHIVHEIGAAESAGLARFLEYARELRPAAAGRAADGI